MAPHQMSVSVTHILAPVQHLPHNILIGNRVPVKMIVYMIIVVVVVVVVVVILIFVSRIQTVLLQ